MKLFIYIGSGALIIFSACADTANTSQSASKVKKDFTQEVYAPEEYVQWVQDEQYPLTKEKKIDELVFSARYKPHEYIICQEERKNEIPDSVMKKKVAEIEDMEYYDLKIELEDGSGELLKHNLSGGVAQYDERVKYFAFGMQKDVHMVVDGKDTVECGLFHFERGYNVVPYAKFMLGFPKQDKKVNKRMLVFHDKVFQKGIIKFHFTAEELKNIPQLKTL